MSKIKASPFPDMPSMNLTKLLPRDTPRSLNFGDLLLLDLRDHLIEIFIRSVLTEIGEAHLNS